MSKSYKKNILVGGRGLHRYVVFCKHRRKKRRRSQDRQELRTLIANQTSEETNEGVQTGWGERMGWTGSVDERFEGDDRHFVYNWWSDPYEGVMLVNKAILKKLDKDDEKYKWFVELMHKKYDRYLKDKHMKHQDKKKKKQSK